MAISIEVTTTITTTVDVETLKSSHDVKIEAGGLDESVASSIVIGGLRSALQHFGYKTTKLEDSE